ncbi:aromatic ring-hydroxylating oxygenase subunit alpha [Marinobacter salsuginis]|uniref:aromatic ring-hydroxylating oxygenase subunit alpha n=1 Tax=Marinobacter salsuginis TaxID=418719 RepID=UPI001ADFCAFD|nr:SRPBCC family protein [Marinobacter salsuginis]QTN40773.1 Rieske 2Fe-2S domain-containing protein [Marinobacter salsuginis]
MNRSDETRLLRQCLNLLDEKSTTLSSEAHHSAVERYTDAVRFDKELSAIHRKLPIAYLHSSELPEPHHFRTVITHVGSVIFSRGDDGIVRAFHNVCRHRGAQVENREAGCSKSFSCPYHAWRYGTNGELLSVPFEETCFPGLDKHQHGLAAIPCVEAYGFIWLCPAAASEQEAHAQLHSHLLEVIDDLTWLGLDKLHVFEKHVRRWKCNWKIVNEGGLETYHFKFAHKSSIGPYFLSNTCVTHQLGAHFRVIMPTEKLKQVQAESVEETNLRDVAHIVYGITPQTTFLVQKAHVDWIQMIPISVDETEIVITQLIPTSRAELSPSEHAHWKRNMEISILTLDEDFELGESIQAGLKSGANKVLTFGRNEGALAKYNQWVEDQLALE